VLGAPDEERDEAARVVERVLGHHVLNGARAAGATCRREAQVSIALEGVLVDGQVDLAFETPEGWTVVDFKTDAELGEAEDVYRRQVGLYAHAISRITGRPARGLLLRV
jgi:ATP-dependent exoDNAse (exonuclease V) beta subunit